MSKYFTALFSVVRLIYMKYFLRLNVDFHPLQSHSLFSTVKIQKTGELVLAKNTQFSADCEIFLAKGARVKIGERTYFNKRCIVSAHKEISIGANCLFGPDVKVYDNNHVIKAGVGIVHGEHNSKPIRIGNNCWLASNVVILAGTIIGNNCVIGAGVVVKGHIPDDSIVKSNDNYRVVKIQ